MTQTRRRLVWLLFAGALLGVVLPAIFWIVETEKRIRTLEDYLHFRDRWSQASFTCHIVSSDGPAHYDYHSLTYYVSPTNQTQRLSIDGIKATGKAVAAWVGECTPRSELLKFEEFRLVPDSSVGFAELVVRPRGSEKIDMTFTAHLLLQDYVRDRGSR